MKNILSIIIIFVFLVGCQKPLEQAQESYDKKDYKSALKHLKNIKKSDENYEKTLAK